MGKMTARQVATELRKSARWHRDFGGELARQAYDKSADFVREHLIETDEQRRERFGAWCAFRGFSTERHRTGPYLANVTQAAWYAWQAALTWRGETKGGGS